MSASFRCLPKPASVLKSRVTAYMLEQPACFMSYKQLRMMMLLISLHKAKTARSFMVAWI